MTDRLGSHAVVSRLSRVFFAQGLGALEEVLLIALGPLLHETLDIVFNLSPPGS